MKHPEKISADNLFCGIEGVVSIALLRQRVETYGGMQLTKCESIALFDRIAELEQFKEWAEPQIVTHGEDVLKIEELERENAALESQIKDAVEDAAKYARLARAASDRSAQPPLAIESLDKLLESESDEPIEILRDGSVRRLDQPPSASLDHSKLCDLFIQELMSTRLQNWSEQSQDHSLLLVDRLSVGPTITTGKEEIEIIADVLAAIACEAIEARRPAPAEQAQPAQEDGVDRSGYKGTYESFYCPRFLCDRCGNTQAVPTKEAGL